MTRPKDSVRRQLAVHGHNRSTTGPAPDRSSAHSATQGLWTSSRHSGHAVGRADFRIPQYARLAAPPLRAPCRQRAAPAPQRPGSRSGRDASDVHCGYCARGPVDSVGRPHSLRTVDGTPEASASRECVPALPAQLNAIARSRRGIAGHARGTLMAFARRHDSAGHHRSNAFTAILLAGPFRTILAIRHMVLDSLALPGSVAAFTMEPGS